MSRSELVFEPASTSLGGADDFPTPHDFEEHRNRFGGLVLLPKDFNASYGGMPYKEKVEHYLGQNLLARSLHPGAYRRCLTRTPWTNARRSTGRSPK